MFCVKSNFAKAFSYEALRRRDANGTGWCGFWVADLHHVLESGRIRIADMDTNRFVLEADIDPAGTHVVQRQRVAEYLDHEWRKRACPAQTPDVLNDLQRTIDQCINDNRVIVHFVNAHEIDLPAGHRGRNPVWYV